MCLIVVAQTIVVELGGLVDFDNLPEESWIPLAALGVMVLVVLPLVITFVIITVKLSRVFNRLPITIALAMVSAIYAVNFISLIVLLVQAHKEFKVRNYKMNLLSASIINKSKI